MKRFCTLLFAVMFFAVGTGWVLAAETAVPAETKAVKTHLKKTVTPKKKHHKKHVEEQKAGEIAKA